MHYKEKHYNFCGARNKQIVHHDNVHNENIKIYTIKEYENIRTDVDENTYVQTL